MAASFGHTSSLLREGAALMTNAPVRDPLADDPLAPENAAFLVIDYQQIGSSHGTASCFTRSPGYAGPPDGAC
jgi:hypothetical protein